MNDPADHRIFSVSLLPWGKRWLKELEDSSPAFASRFKSSKRLAGPDALVEFHMGPGHVHGRVVDRRGELHTVDLAVALLSEGEKEDLAHEFADRSEHLASILDGELPRELVESIEELEIAIFPRPSQLRSDCSCADYSDPCVHAGALCVAAARSFDKDPFTLFELRGFPRSELLDEVRRQRQSVESGDVSGDGIQTDSNPWSGWDSGRDLGVPPASPDHIQPVLVAPEAMLDGAMGEILGLARRDAAIRARDVIQRSAPSMLTADYEVDLARLASGPDWDNKHSTVARVAGLSASELDALIEAWRRAGSEGVEMLINKRVWSTDQTQLATARDELVEAGFERREIALNYNSLGLGHTHTLSLGPSGAWYLLADGDRRNAQRLIMGPVRDLLHLTHVLGARI